jgi:hypothetical protein
VVEIVPKQGVEVLYLLKPEMKFTFGLHESILERRHGIICIQPERVATGKKQICLFGVARSFQV